MQKNIGWVNFYSNVFFLSWVLNFEHSPIKFSKPGATSFLLLVKTHLTWWRPRGSGDSLLLCPPRGAGSILTLRQLQPAATGQLWKWRSGHKHLLLLDPSQEEEVAPPAPFGRPPGPPNESTLKSSGPLSSPAVNAFCSKPRAVN